MGSWNESELVGEMRAGNREACARLVREHHAPVYRLLYHLTQDVHLAEDLTQETFATAWQRIDQFEGRASPGTWLHRIAYNKFVDACRGAERSGPRHCGNGSSSSRPNHTAQTRWTGCWPTNAPDNFTARSPCSTNGTAS